MRMVMLNELKWEMWGSSYYFIAYEPQIGDNQGMAVIVGTFAVWDMV